MISAACVSLATSQTCANENSRRVNQGRRTTWATLGPEGKPRAEGGTWDRELVLLETLTLKLQIAKDGNNVFGVTTLPQPTLRAKGGTARLAPRS